MWKRLSSRLCCIECRGSLELLSREEKTLSLPPQDLAQGEQMGIAAPRLAEAVESGLLVCHECRLWFPVLHGLPVLLPYRTPLHDEFLALHASAVQALGSRYRPPNQVPEPGEAFVQRSFSSEWLDYSYDGVLWTWTYEDRKALFEAEIGAPFLPLDRPASFLEVGCGLGIVTSFAGEALQGDAVGVDLSLAALRATRHFAASPFLHFVQASLWNLPFSAGSFDLVYSHGVLHHTHSTQKALAAIAPLVRPGGLLYVWVYGTASIDESLSRRLAYAVEALLRPVLGRLPTPAANLVLTPAALGYMVLNRLQRLAGSPRETYDFQRARHAARDRLTPLHAFRTDAATLVEWFEEIGFGELEALNCDDVPPAARETVRRNVGLRGTRRIG